jgi:Lon protease-like protein
MSVEENVEGRIIPLFPLQTTLAAGGRMALRIFEPRYLDMVKEVAGKKESFGIIQILSGQDVGPTPTIAAYGMLATIIDFETLSDGLLGITVQGERPFKIRYTWVQDNGLLRAHILPTTEGEKQIGEKIGPENSGPMDRQVAQGLGITPQEYVDALLNKRVKTQHLESGTLVDGIKLSKPRVIFRYQGRSTHVDLDE